MKIKEWKPYFIVDFKRGATKSTVEIDDCSTDEIKELCHNLFKKYQRKADSQDTGVRITVRKILRDTSCVVYGQFLVNKTPIQFRKMLETNILI